MIHAYITCVVRQGYTPLHHACESGDVRCLAALVDVGASLYAR